VTGSTCLEVFPISRDPPEGGTPVSVDKERAAGSCFQFLGIPPKGELERQFGEQNCQPAEEKVEVSNF